MHPENDRSSVLGARYWAPARGDDFHAMRVLPATGPVHEVLTYLDALPSQYVVGSVPSALADAVDVLSELDAQQRLRAPAVSKGTMDRALGALRNLRRALEAESEDLGLKPSPVTTYLADPPALQQDLRRAIGEMLRERLASVYDHVATFSLILFCEDSHGGALSTSLREERASWLRALKPPQRGSPDVHLAIIPPPSAVEGVRYLAAELGCEDRLPCVVFLGDKPQFSRELYHRLVAWSSRGLRPAPPSYSDQLGEIYRTVYARGALAPGSPMTAAADKFLTMLRGLLGARAALRLLAGAAGGSKLVEAAESMFSDIKDRESE